MVRLSMVWTLIRGIETSRRGSVPFRRKPIRKNNNNNNKTTTTTEAAATATTKTNFLLADEWIAGWFINFWSPFRLSIFHVRNEFGGNQKSPKSWASASKWQQMRRSQKKWSTPIHEIEKYFYNCLLNQAKSVVSIEISPPCLRKTWKYPRRPLHIWKNMILKWWKQQKREKSGQKKLVWQAARKKKNRFVREKCKSIRVERQQTSKGEREREKQRQRPKKIWETGRNALRGEPRRQRFPFNW